MELVLSLQGAPLDLELHIHLGGYLISVCLLTPDSRRCEGRNHNPVLLVLYLPYLAKYLAVVGAKIFLGGGGEERLIGSHRIQTEKDTGNHLLSVILKLEKQRPREVGDGGEGVVYLCMVTVDGRVGMCQSWSLSIST